MKFGGVAEWLMRPPRKRVGEILCRFESCPLRNVKQKNKKYLLGHREDDTAFLTISMNQEGFSHRLFYDYFKLPLFRDNFLIFKNGYLDWFGNEENWKEVRDAVLDRIKNDKTFGKTILNKSLEIAKKLEKECNKTLKNWKQIISLLNKLYCTGLAPAISDIRHFTFTRLMEGIIAKKIEQLKLNRPIGDYFSVLTTPIPESLFQKSEKELLKLAIEIKKKKLNKKEIDQKIEKYLEKYKWIEYGHLGPTSSPGSIRKKLGKYLKENPGKKLKELISQKNALPKNQKKLETELKLNQKEKQLFQTARDFGQHKAHRLAITYLVNYTINQALKVLAKKYDYFYKELRNLTKDEFFAMIKSGKKVSKNILKQRQKFSINHIISYGKVKVYIGKEAREFVRKYVPKEEIDTSQQTIEGTVACTGKAIGKVKIINSSADMAKMDKGDVLIAVQTTPQLLPAMKKAAAFVTDIGGLTCHAAIVARELNTPCIIGAWNATKILKDNDLVEVDADEGVVKILEK